MAVIRRTSLLLLFCVMYVTGSLNTTKFYEPITHEIEWEDCGLVPKAVCGHFEVLLDWHNPSAGKGRLAVIKYNATGERKGVLFTHAGLVPGDGRGWLVERSEVMMDYLVNGSYDLVTWDLRGTPLRRDVNDPLQKPSSPTCFSSREAEVEFWNEQTSIGVPKSNFSMPPSVEYQHPTVYAAYEHNRRLGLRCLTASQEDYPDIPMLKYMGTAASVRDLVALADYLQGPGTPINFHGVYHGSLIGSYLINMFPERVGHVILDRPVNPLVAGDGQYHTAWRAAIRNANETFVKLTDRCETNTEQCTIVGAKKTGEYVREYVQFALAMTRSSLLGWQPIFGMDLISNPTLKRLVFAVYNATEGPDVSFYNWTYELHTLTRNMWHPNLYGELASFCGDYAYNYTEYPEGDREHLMIAGWITDFMMNAPLIGQSFPAARYLCHLWPERAVERYTGPWNRKPANRVLVVGNTLNPLSGIDQAKAIAGAMGDDAYFVEEEGFAFSFFPHTARANEVMSVYLLNDTLPSRAEGTPQGSTSYVNSIYSFFIGACRLLANQSGVFLTIGAFVSSLSLMTSIAIYRWVRKKKSKVDGDTLATERNWLATDEDVVKARDRAYLHSGRMLSPNLTA
ncbi:unnamed protein product [Somion occarium]|uniref:Peptidase S33 tripeptidyl aminopeptidase-like C-terminal domain-containing protein n=1 Tax=Somion occarium TaxID=3059160 RepID=A0ABP1DY29_9APHY